MMKKIKTIPSASFSTVSAPGALAVTSIQILPKPSMNPSVHTISDSPAVR